MSRPGRRGNYLRDTSFPHESEPRESTEKIGFFTLIIAVDLTVLTSSPCFYTFFLNPMTDKLSKEKRSWNMSRIKSSNTKPEMVVRSLLHAMGHRYRLHRKDLPGKPDIVLPKYKTVIFINGCFWHRHSGCNNATMPKTNTEFWEKKLLENVERDIKKQADLENLGWNVIVIWECETEKPSAELSIILKEWISGHTDKSNNNDLLMVAEKRSEYRDTDG